MNTHNEAGESYSLDEVLRVDLLEDRRILDLVLAREEKDLGHDLAVLGSSWANGRKIRPAIPSCYDAAAKAPAEADAWACCARLTAPGGTPRTRLNARAKAASER
jgi:hypothetical protein